MSKNSTAEVRDGYLTYALPSNKAMAAILMRAHQCLLQERARKLNAVLTGRDLLRERALAEEEALARARNTTIGQFCEEIRAKHEMLILTTPYGGSTVHHPNYKHCRRGERGA